VTPLIALVPLFRKVRPAKGDFRGSIHGKSPQTTKISGSCRTRNRDGIGWRINGRRSGGQFCKQLICKELHTMFLRQNEPASHDSVPRNPAPMYKTDLTVPETAFAAIFCFAWLGGLC
jgi:hypothetical protein